MTKEGSWATQARIDAKDSCETLPDGYKTDVVVHEKGFGLTNEVERKDLLRTQEEIVQELEKRMAAGGADEATLCREQLLLLFPNHPHADRWRTK